LREWFRSCQTTEGEKPIDEMSGIFNTPAPHSRRLKVVPS